MQHNHFEPPVRIPTGQGKKEAIALAIGATVFALIVLSFLLKAW